MKTTLLSLVLLAALCSHSWASDFDQFKPRVQKEPVTIEDLMAALEVNIYKYKLRLPPGNDIEIIFQNHEDSEIKKVKPAENFNFDHTLKVYFFNEDGTPVNVWKEKSNTLHLSVNWDYMSVTTFPIKNFLKNYDNYYIESKSYDFGEAIIEKTNLLKFFGKTEDGTEKLIAEIYISLKKAE